MASPSSREENLASHHKRRHKINKQKHGKENKIKGEKLDIPDVEEGDFVFYH